MCVHCVVKDGLAEYHDIRKYACNCPDPGAESTANRAGGTHLQQFWKKLCQLNKSEERASVYPACERIPMG